MKILCFGNEFIEDDALAKKVADILKKESGFDIIKCDSENDLLDYLEEEIVILDVVKGIKGVRVFDENDIDYLDTSELSAHDFDLGFQLKILQKIEKIDKLKIIGIPMKGNARDIAEEIIEILKD